MEDLSAEISERDAIALLEQMSAAAFGGVHFPTGNGTAVPPKSPPPVDSPTPARGKLWQPDLRYRSLVERLPVVTFMASLNDTVQELYVSPQIEVLLGFTQEEWLENPILWYRQLHPDDREKWVTEFARTCATGTHFRAEYRLFARDGHVVWVQGECQLIRDETGRPLFLQGIAFDITHLKRAALVEEARLAAEAASVAKSEFLARMSHEIRTPLNGVVGMIDLLRGTELTENQQRYAQLARESADALMLVINDILDFSKIEAGKVEIEAVEFDLYKVVEDLTELMAPVAARRNLALAGFLRPELPRNLIGDPNRIRQVLTNLVGNALKFTPTGRVSVRASLERHQDADVFVRIEVEDTGIGIPADRLDRLFKSFSQVDSSTTRKFGGTGLGLAISKRLVELMRGEIGIRSTEGVGTTFWFTLKLAAASQPKGVSAVVASADELRNQRVLGVESTPMYRQILTEQFDGWVSPASEVVSAGEAIAKLLEGSEQGRPFTIALIPYGGMEGPSLATAIHSEAALRQIKLIAVADANDSTKPVAMAQAGFSGRLHRPVTQTRLLEAIATAKQERPAKQRAAVAPPTVQQNGMKGLHLLVAEDNEMNQFVTREILRRAECTCDIAGDGLAAVQAVRQAHYDAILMDCQMPNMDGLEATRRIREIEATNRGSRRIPIIALTAEAIQGDREKCLAAGMDGYVTKPISPSDLFAAVTELLPAKAPPPPAPAPTAPEASKNDGPPLDIEGLLVRCMRDAQFACKTLEKFHQRAGNDVERLRQGVVDHDSENVKRIAHNLKSVAAHVGAEAMRRLAQEIEAAGERQDLEFVEERLPQLHEEAVKCAAYIPDAIRKIAGGEASKASTGQPR